MESYNITKNINRKITLTEAGNVTTIVNNAVTEGEGIISINTFVDNLKVYAFIKSLDPVRLPNFKLEDSETDKLYKTLDVEFNSPRKQLDVVISDNGTDWNLIGSVSLLNPSGYPYRMYNLLDFFTDGLGARLGNNFRIGVRVKDVGFGVLSGEDMLTVHGSYVQEYVVSTATQIPSAGYQKSTSIVSSTVLSRINGATLIASNTSRIGATIWNDSTSVLYIDFDSSVSMVDFARKLEPNGYCEVPFGYTGVVTGIWESVNGSAIIREFI